MNNGLVGILAVAAIGGFAFYSTGAKASESDSDLEFVTGQSGTTYGVRFVGSSPGVNGQTVLTFDVEDVSGVILRYSQFQGDNSSRILIATPDAPHAQGDPMWLQAIQDFGVFVG